MTLDDLIAKQEITEVLYNYARAIDRMDRDLLLACYHPDGTDQHVPFFSGGVVEFADWVMGALAAMVAQRHVISNISITLHGDTAGVESYWTATLQIKEKEGLVDLMRAGRYIDQFERRDGTWRILTRSAFPEFSHRTPVAQSSNADASSIRGQGEEVMPPKIARDRNDISYRVLEKARG